MITCILWYQCNLQTIALHAPVHTLPIHFYGIFCAKANTTAHIIIYFHTHTVLSISQYHTVMMAYFNESCAHKYDVQATRRASSGSAAAFACLCPDTKAPGGEVETCLHRIRVNGRNTRRDSLEARFHRLKINHDDTRGNLPSRRNSACPQFSTTLYTRLCYS